MCLCISLSWYLIIYEGLIKTKLEKKTGHNAFTELFACVHITLNTNPKFAIEYLDIQQLYTKTHEDSRY